MELVDTHCHLYSSEFSDDRSDMIERARNAGVTKCFLPAIDRSSFQELLKLESDFPQTCVAMAGLHPCSVKSDFREELDFFEGFFKGRKFAAVGETGLDFYWDRSFEKEQYLAFNVQIDWAIRYDLPVVIHSRNSIEDTIRTVRERQNGRLKGIFHCFNETEDLALQIIELGFYLGIGGVITYKNSKLPAVIRNIDLRHILLETDSPYLPPVPFRGKRNESSYLPYIAQALAVVKGIDPEEVARITTENALNIFGR
jgi:TatD DNase family protein